MKMLQKGISREAVEGVVVHGDVGQTFLNQLDDFLLNHRTRNAYYERKGFRPSASHNTERNLFYSLIGAEEDKNATTAPQFRRLDCGTYTHNRTEDYLSVWNKMNGRFKTKMIDGKPAVEVKGFNKEFNFGGTCDAQLEYTNDNGEVEDIVFEFKTISKAQFDKLKEPKEAHISQCVTYAVLFGIKKSLVVYETFEKGWGVKPDMKAYLVEVTEEQIAEMKAKIRRVQEAVETRTCPPCDKKMCSETYCKYKTQCEADGIHAVANWGTPEAQTIIPEDFDEFGGVW